MSYSFFHSFRLNIPPFVKARTVLEGLQTHLSDEDRKSVVKVEVTDTEVKEEVTNTEVKEEVTDREVRGQARFTGHCITFKGLQKSVTVIRY